ncbi:MAG: DNA-binding response regulator, partial [Bacilli bacterium]
MGQAEQIQDLQKKEYIDALHGNSKGWITKAEKKEVFKQWHYKYVELIDQDLQGENIYISINTFFSTYRRLEY